MIRFQVDITTGPITQTQSWSGPTWPDLAYLSSGQGPTWPNGRDATAPYISCFRALTSTTLERLCAVFFLHHGRKRTKDNILEARSIRRPQTSMQLITQPTVSNNRNFVKNSVENMWILIIIRITGKIEWFVAGETSLTSKIDKNVSIALWDILLTDTCTDEQTNWIADRDEDNNSLRDGHRRECTTWPFWTLSKTLSTKWTLQTLLIYSQLQEPGKDCFMCFILRTCNFGFRSHLFLYQKFFCCQFNLKNIPFQIFATFAFS